MINWQHQIPISASKREAHLSQVCRWLHQIVFIISASQHCQVAAHVTSNSLCSWFPQTPIRASGGLTKQDVSLQEVLIEWVRTSANSSIIIRPFHVHHVECAPKKINNGSSLHQYVYGLHCIILKYWVTYNEIHHNCNWQSFSHTWSWDMQYSKDHGNHMVHRRLTSIDPMEGWDFCGLSQIYMFQQCWRCQILKVMDQGSPYRSNLHVSVVLKMSKVLDQGSTYRSHLHVSVVLKMSKVMDQDIPYRFPVSKLSANYSIWDAFLD